MTSQYGANAMRAGLARLQARMRMHTHTPTRPGNHTHARTHAHTCTHRPISNTYCFSTAIMIRERTSMLRYTYIAPLVMYSTGSVKGLSVRSAARNESCC